MPAKNIGAGAGPPTSAQLYLLDRPGAEQSVILVGAVAPPKANPDEFAYMTFNDAFGGSFSVRINMNLREDKHWAYGAGSFAFDARGQRRRSSGRPCRPTRRRSRWPRWRRSCGES